jgi:hypothetical protein
MVKPAPHPQPQIPLEHIRCLRCDWPFDRWDRRQNRLCPGCFKGLQGEPSDEPVWRPPKSRHLPRDA